MIDIMFKVTLTKRDNSREGYLCDSYHLYRKGYFINLFEKMSNNRILRKCINLTPDYKRVEVIELKTVIRTVEEFDI